MGIVVLIVGSALVFDVTNGFHDSRRRRASLTHVCRRRVGGSGHRPAVRTIYCNHKKILHKRTFTI